MTTALNPAPTPKPPADDVYVLPAHLTAGMNDRGPRFSDDVWELRAVLPRTRMGTRLDFTGFVAGEDRQTAKEYLYSRLRHPSGRTGLPMKPTAAREELAMFARALRDLRALEAPRLRNVERHHLTAALALWKRESVHTAAAMVRLLQHVAAHGRFLTRDRLGLVPWEGRSANAVAGLSKPAENTTPRIPEDAMRALLNAALFYVETASHDIFAAQEELARLEEQRSRRGKAGDGEVRHRLEDLIEQRRSVGRGLPALPRALAHTKPEARIIDGVVQAPNLRMLTLLLRAGHIHHQLPRILEAGQELGWDEGGLGTPISPWPATGRPWRPEMSPATLASEIVSLRVACWIVIAYLSGMRDVEVRELGRDCAFTEPGADGRLRYKVRGRVFKGRRLSGDEAEWVVLDIVHRAIDVLLRINDDPTHLFGYTGGPNVGYVMLRAVPGRLAVFCAHLNELFGTAEEPYIPLVAVQPAMAADSLHDTGVARQGPERPVDGEATGTRLLPWAFNTRQFRRTLAWHIAHQPFGVVAGTRQYKHAAYAIFEGYAGTSASGFADEVAADQTVAKLDYVEDLFHDWNEGGRSVGGAAQRVEAEFDRIRAETGDLPGVVSSPTRLRAMLRHLTRTLHPGMLNDCFHQAETAVCNKRAKSLGRPLPMLSMCLQCPNSRRSAVHLPRLLHARDQARQDFPDLDALPHLQQIAITEHLSSLTRLIAEIHDEGDRPA
ncbi:hypothetical protein [Streptomyces sp. NPDC087294]|uniref:hypothetical protein n=1 Tax=Streptomyces sp. NPDC087294 TaxID=3365777 RepID=UPI003810B050